MVAEIYEMVVQKVEHVVIKLTMDMAYKLKNELGMIEDLEEDTALMELNESLEMIL